MGPGTPGTEGKTALERRTAGCGEIGLADAGKSVVLLGWVNKRRDHGGLVFVDLRDRTGLVQVVFSPESGVEKGSFATAETVRPEYVLEVSGVVRRRPEGTLNPNLATGAIEVEATGIRVLNPAKTPPFAIAQEKPAGGSTAGAGTAMPEVDENVRLRYRYLDLRRPPMQANLILRHRTAKAVRDFLDSRGFLEVETPMLTKSTPEGARDYLVPSRVHPGAFYALPQSPQLFKQLLMVAGLEKYFQIVRCFRDEDLRADRQPEFTQIDIEMSFAEMEDVLRLTEDMVGSVFERVLGLSLPRPFERLSWNEAMERFGSDKPDTRFGMELVEVTDVVARSGFKVFADQVAAGGRVKGINASGCAHFTRRELDELTREIAEFGARGLAWIALEADGGARSPIAKFLSQEELESLKARLGAVPGDLLLLVADRKRVVEESLGYLRLRLARTLDLIPEGKFNFLWVTHFPLLEWDEDEKRYVAVHHPFTAPTDEDRGLLSSRPGEVRSKSYDLVLNGTELGGGSIRIHRRDVQETMFAALGLSPEEARDKFGFLLDAFEYGTPPHGGIAFGFDRMIMLIAGAHTIREVIAFPKTQSATDLMTQAPAEVSEAQLRELRLKTLAAPAAKP